VIKSLRQVLSIFTVSITDADLAHLAGVHTLNLSDCSEITDAGLTHLRGLDAVNLDSCSKITTAGLAELGNVWVIDECTDENEPE
jgi:hypothetical protein